MSNNDSQQTHRKPTPFRGGSFTTEDVREFIDAKGIEAEIKVLEQNSTRTSALAAQQLNCTIAEIAKTIAFACIVNGNEIDVLVILSGDKKVDTYRLGEKLKASSVQRMEAEEVKEATGYVIGGVPPFPHAYGIKVLVDKSLMRFRRVWGAAGAPNAVMHISPVVLLESLGCELVDVSG